MKRYQRLTHSSVLLATPNYNFSTEICIRKLIAERGSSSGSIMLPSFLALGHRTSYRACPVSQICLLGLGLSYCARLLPLECDSLLSLLPSVVNMIATTCTSTDDSYPTRTASTSP